MSGGLVHDLQQFVPQCSRRQMWKQTARSWIPFRIKRMVKARNCFTSPETLIDHSLSIPILLQLIEKQFDKAGHSTVQGPTQGG